MTVTTEVQYECDDCGDVRALPFEQVMDELAEPEGWWMILSPDRAEDQLHFCSVTCAYRYFKDRHEAAQEKEPSE